VLSNRYQLIWSSKPAPGLVIANAAKQSYELRFVCTPLRHELHVFFVPFVTKTKCGYKERYGHKGNKELRNFTFFAYQ
jgi:hypothetical protein